MKIQIKKAVRVQKKKISILRLNPVSQLELQQNLILFKSNLTNFNKIKF